MPVILTPIIDVAPQPGQTCDEQLIARPEDAIAEGCPVLTKLRSVIVDKGVLATVEWAMRTPDGKPIRLDSCGLTEPTSSLSSSSSASSLSASSLSSLSLTESDLNALKVRFTRYDGREIEEIDALPHDLVSGTVRFELPACVVDTAGIYVMHIAVVRTDARPIVINKGLLSVERGLWGDTQSVIKGPPTLVEMRMAMRDTALENNLLANVEFDSEEIIFAMTRPIQQWNDTPPPVARYSVANFPFRYYWLKAIVAELLMIASHHYLRNKLQANQGGLSVDDKNKNTEYVQLAQLYYKEWRDFIVHKKVELNAAQGFGSIGSSYSLHRPF